MLALLSLGVAVVIRCGWFGPEVGNLLSYAGNDHNRVTGSSVPALRPSKYWVQWSGEIVVKCLSQISVAMVVMSEIVSLKIMKLWSFIRQGNSAM
jgi:hypothetical protein